MAPVSSIPELPITSLLDDNVSFPFSVTGGLRRRLERHQAMFGSMPTVEHFDYQDLRGASAARHRVVRPKVLEATKEPPFTTSTPSPFATPLTPETSASGATTAELPPHWLKPSITPQSLAPMAFPAAPETVSPSAVNPSTTPVPPAKTPEFPSSLLTAQAPTAPVAKSPEVVPLPAAGPQFMAPTSKPSEQPDARLNTPAADSIQPLLNMPAPPQLEVSKVEEIHSEPTSLFDMPESRPAQQPVYRVREASSFHITDQQLQKKTWNVIDMATKLPTADDVTLNGSRSGTDAGAWAIRDQAPKLADWTTVKAAPTPLAETIDVNLEGHRTEAVSKAEAHALENLPTSNLRSILMNAAVCAILITALFGILTAISHH